jgi:G3E family GTPase
MLAPSPLTFVLSHFERPGKKIAVIENEFGAVDVDGQLLEHEDNLKTEDEVVEMLNGCVCCTVRTDLQKVLVKLLKTEKRKLDGIIIETTGLADPAPVAQTFFVDPDLEGLCYLDAIITMVDASHIDQQLDRERPEGVENEAEEQLAFADKIILNKMDLVPDRAKVDATVARIKKYNPLAEIIETTHGNVAADLLLGIDSFNLQKVLEKEPDFLDTGAEHQHDNSVSSLCVQDDSPICIGLLEDWIGELLKDFGENLFRYKGILNCQGSDRRFVFQGVHMLFDGNFTTLWKPEEKRINRFVFIGRNLPTDRLEREFSLCKAKPLRFDIGTRVLANVGGFKQGTVTAHWDAGNAYRIDVDGLGEVFSRIDDDRMIKAYKKRPEPPK